MRTVILVLPLMVACGFPRPAEHSADAGGDAAPMDAADPCPAGGCQLVAIEPSIANTGDTIMLEGTFASDAGRMPPDAPPGRYAYSVWQSSMPPQYSSINSSSVIPAGAR